jgi:hypothetical protein
MAQKLRERIDEWNCMKLQSFCTAKEMIIRLKRKPTEWERIFARCTSDKGLITRIYRVLKKLNSWPPPLQCSAPQAWGSPGPGLHHCPPHSGGTPHGHKEAEVITLSARLLKHS